MSILSIISYIFFFFNYTATTEIYTLSLHDALPISIAPNAACEPRRVSPESACQRTPPRRGRLDRKSTRLNSSHPSISYAVFCLKKKKKNKARLTTTSNSYNITGYNRRYHHI